MNVPTAHFEALKRTGVVAFALSLVFSGLGHDARAAEATDPSAAVRVEDGQTKVLEDEDVTCSHSDGVTAEADATALMRNVRVAVTGPAACGMRAQANARMQASDLKVTCTGRRGPAVVAERDSQVSVTASSLRVTGGSAPIARADGCMDLSRVEARSQQGALGTVGDHGSLLVVDSSLTSGLERDHDRDAYGFAIEGHGTNRTRLTCLRSNLTSGIAEGAMLHVSDATTDIVLDSTKMSYDSYECDLLRAQSQSDVHLAIRASELEGNVFADARSSAHLSIENDATWTGLPSGDGAVDVSVDASSNWVVADSCTVRSLRIEPGAVVVDERGETVSVVCAGETLIRGKSDVCVNVSETYETGAHAAASELQLPQPLDRSDFDSAFGTNTSLSASVTSSPRTPMAPAQLQAGQVSPSLLDIFLDWIKETMGI